MRNYCTPLMALVLIAATAAGQENKDNPQSTPVNNGRRQAVDVVFIGTDCGIGNFGAKEASRKVWDKHFGRLKTVRLHIGGEDWTAPKLPLQRCEAKVVVMLVGGRPVVIDRKDPAAVAKGIATTLKLVRESQPQAKVVLCGIPLPPTPGFLNRSVGPNQELAGDQVAKSNELVAKLADGKWVFFVDPVLKMRPRLKEISEGLKKQPDLHDVTAIWECIAETMDEAVRPLLK
jgi:hypothetical protein